ncbi:MAG: ABC transporter substrate-binding protein [Anaerolineae bacterium]
MLIALLPVGCAAPSLLLPAGPASPESAPGGQEVAATVPVVLGAVYNLTGGQAGLDVPSSHGARLAIDQANAAGGVLGRPVELVLRDGETDLATIGARTTEIVEQYPATAALFGLSDTDPVLAAAPAAARAGRLFLASGATSPKLPEQVPGYLYLACFGDNVQAAAGAEWAYHHLGARTASIVFNQNSTYSQLLHGYFQTRFEALGGRVLSVEGFLPGATENIAAVVGSLPPADLVYLSLTPDVVLDTVLAVRAAGDAGPILGGDGFDVAGLWEQHPEVNQVYFTTHVYLGPDNDDPAVLAFRNAYGQAYPDSPAPDAFAALGYDAARLLLLAVDHAGSTDPEAVRQALAGIRQFQGVTGQIGFPTGSHIPVKSVAIVSADAGTVKLEEQVMPEQVPPP